MLLYCRGAPVYPPSLDGPIRLGDRCVDRLPNPYCGCCPMFPGRGLKSPERDRLVVSLGREPKRWPRESKLLPKRGDGEGERDRARTLSVRERLLEISRLIPYLEDEAKFWLLFFKAKSMMVLKPFSKGLKFGSEPKLLIFV